MTRTANGFTLIELLVAMIAGALLMGWLGWAVAVASRQLQEPPGAASDAHILLAERTLGAMVARASVPGAALATFRGDARGFRIMVPAPAALGRIGRVFLVAREAAGDRGEELRVRFEPADQATPLPAFARQDIMLLDGLDTIAFDYGPPQDPARVSLPGYIRLRLGTRYDGERTIMLVPRLNSDGTCRFDPISQLCRP